MGRPPCCDKVGVKKGPWTPEEDIILVSYIQEHGPGNWRAVPANTGLLRCSKSCRLRWTNYLRPGIKRGNFTDHEEKMIVHLQALLDNDIKNYWNTHLMKKLKKQDAGLDGHHQDELSATQTISKGQWERRLQTDIHMAKRALCEALSLGKPIINQLPDSNPPYQAPTYASSADNIARLLENWKKSSPKSAQTATNSETTQNSSSEAFDSLLSLNSSTYDVSQSVSVDEGANLTPETSIFQDESKSNTEAKVVPLTLLEKWLFDDGAAHAQEDLINMSLEDGAGLF
ncbi:hypothetical protein FH972_018949 [Carpinus fangiana]|uniref:Uncharacterized protein n=1 Tax=Carpinus fangiana TaxID=176857 RepID=A0A5N6RQ37_9ROSI|nr:hypothetical protein FH972_018949 [Carpinus fangiana]